ncbi:necrosis inducing protein-domain-containing protein [Podospora didyma]|uniref:Necrosis inducing protein-domain-containing protein n=1 Tax=Podospora didyma TaxID=330526 RepID=A0AAE0U4E8_9PEZI|nr:necrosis inducing protein-domain-containing protein [Podospora didyma]
MYFFAAVALLLGSALTTVSATPVANAERPFSTPSFIGLANDPEAHKFQPVLDFDNDGCYYTSAIDSGGSTNPGLNYAQGVPPNCLRATCRDANRLQNSNVYSRSRCNNGWCAIMYEYYFEKDQVVCGSWGAGHRHDWEHIIVFTQGETVRRVAPSCHNGYGGATNSPRLQGQRAKVVYHKDGGQTHCFRMANAADDSIENYTGQWFLGSLIGWTGWPSTWLRDTAMNANFGAASPKLRGDRFGSALNSAAGGQTGSFNPWSD